MSEPKKREAPTAMARSGAQDSTNDTDIIATSAIAIKARIQAGEIVAATDYPAADRPLFWAVINRVRDDLPCVKAIWRTIGERHVDGVRVRQKMFKIFPRQKGVIDPALAGLIALAAVCAAMLIGGPL